MDGPCEPGLFEHGSISPPPADTGTQLKGAPCPTASSAKIAAHEIPSTIVYEDDLVIAFDDLNPQAPAHTLVISKEHYDNIIDGIPAETLAAMMHAVAEVARIKGLDEGFRVISNKGEAAGQTVMHVHCTCSAASRSAKDSFEAAGPACKISLCARWDACVRTFAL